MRIKLIAFLVLVMVSASRGQSFTPAQFKEFTTMRVGTGSPIYWYCIGEIYSYPDGKLLAKVEGVDTARMIKGESNATRVLQLSRKIFFYRDPITNEVIKEVNGVKLEPISYPYQQISYELRNGKMFADVTQGKAPRVQTIKSEGGNLVRDFGGVTIYSAPLFLNFPTFKAFENYDFLIQKTGKPKYQLTWNRRGTAAAFGGGDSVFQLVSYRIDSYAALPKTMRDVLEAEARLWMAPPKDMNEIKELQK